MGRRFFLSLALIVAIQVGVFSPFALAGGVTIKGKHASEGLQCADCHKTSKPSAAAPVEACLDCHGGYDGVAKLIKGEHNPHDSHLGRMQCLKCHRVHGPSEFICLQCHSEFDFTDK